MSDTVVAIGDRVRLTKSIWDDGEDHHPPGWLARAGEVLIVRTDQHPKTGRIAVSHEQVKGRSFWISSDEYEIAKDTP